MSVTTPNMNLLQPTVGVDTGLTWENNVNTNSNTIDVHNHSSGSGVQINPAGLNINSDLPFNNQNATILRSVRFLSQSSVALAADVGCLYESGVDLYYNDGSGNIIRITQSGSVTGSAGTITGLPSGTASASYGAGVFVFQSTTNTSAVLDGGSYIFRNNVASSPGLTLSAPTLSSDYSLVLPSIPASLSFVTLDASGNMAASYGVDNSTIQINGASNISVKPGGITATQIASSTITATQIASSTITGTQVTSNVNLAGKAVQESGLNVVVSNANDTNSLAIIRGRIAPNGGIMSGSGFTCSNFTTGGYAIIFNTSFGDVPTVVVTGEVSTFGTVILTSVIPSANNVVVTIATPGGSVSSQSFDFIAIGQRA